MMQIKAIETTTVLKNNTVYSTKIQNSIPVIHFLKNAKRLLYIFKNQHKISKNYIQTYFFKNATLQEL